MFSNNFDKVTQIIFMYGYVCMGIAKLSSYCVVLKCIRQSTAERLSLQKYKKCTRQCQKVSWVMVFHSCLIEAQGVPV